MAYDVLRFEIRGASNDQVFFSLLPCIESCSNSFFDLRSAKLRERLLGRKTQLSADFRV